MTNEQKAENAETLKQMKNIAHLFYCAATGLSSHKFIEFTGFLNEYIKACERAHSQGVDFITETIPFKTHEMAYIAEKFDCIFGRELSDPKLRGAFIQSLAEHGGWLDE